MDNEFGELIDEYRAEYSVNNLEGSSGVRKFNKFLGDLGYKHTYLDSDNITNFLSDNPGAIECLFQWIEDNGNEEWAANIESCLPEREKDD